ncbi:uncharacterized protein ARMOST_12234 [Armillaria ostoyae]|uniref:Uncharacterized protein n=1 Tax=Armillaria ostoyae TaxID=47428 RepID=A0A284RJD9_ARMOS|nr:uncharacterized protein ARMOST_12234 [Armillaria ostoyae]
MSRSRSKFVPRGPKHNCLR